MANFEIIMPKMGESIEEATITNWFVKEGDQVEEDDVLLEIATDKVDSEIPSPVAGVVKKIFFKQDEVVAVGTVIALIDTDGSSSDEPAGESLSEKTVSEKSPEAELYDVKTTGKQEGTHHDTSEIPRAKSTPGPGRFYSPLVRKIAREENISQEELDEISGSGINGRVQKNDVLRYLKSMKKGEKAPAKKTAPTEASADSETAGTASPAMETLREGPAPERKVTASAVSGAEAEDEVLEMSRLRKLIADHMIRSKKTSAHVTNMIEIDVTGVVNWRERIKEEFLKKEGAKITYLPVFLEATIRALKDYPQINASVEGDKIILKKRMNLGIAVALPGNNLIVPNIKDADTLNRTGLVKKINQLAQAARNNKLGPDDISGGTFTVTNFGTFRNDIGTPIINQPEVAILAIGAVKKKPAVLETEHGDVIAVRQKMWLSLTYDHRIIDGALGGAFLKRLGDIIESFDPQSGNFKL